MSWSKLIQSINQNIGQITKIVAQGDNSDRGTTLSYTGDQIYIDRLGQITGTHAGTIATVILQGGSINWNNSVLQENITAGYSPLQLATLRRLVNHIQTYNSNVYVESGIL